MSSGTIIDCHHFALCVRDIDEGRRFFAEVLALEELPRPAAIAEQFRSAWYRLGSAELHVIENPEFQPLDSPLGPHMALRCDDFEATIARIEGTGTRFRFGPGKGPDGILRAILSDPTGNVFEIIDAPPVA